MNGKIGAGIIGYGYMGYFHLAKINAMPYMEIRGIYDTDGQKKQQAISDGLKSYESAADLMADDHVDLVIITTPNDSHYEYAMQALAAGKHVLCEKPAMMTLKQLEDVLEKAEAVNRLFTAHQNRRWDKDFSVVKKTVHNRLIGDVWTIYSETYGQRGVCFGWRADPEKGGGMVYDWGIHLIDQMLLLFPEKRVVSINARLRSILTPAVDDYFEIELEFEDEIIAHINIGTFALQDRPRWFLFGDKGSLRLNDFSGTDGGIAKIKDNVRFFSRIPANSNLGPSRTMAHLERQDYEEISLPKAEDHPLAFYNNLQEVLLGNEESLIRPEELLRDMRIIEKVFESGRKHERLKVSI